MNLQLNRRAQNFHKLQIQFLRCHFLILMSQSPVITSLGSQWGVNRTIELFREPGQEIGIGTVLQERKEPSIGDRIVAVNDVDLQNASYKKAIEIIQNSENPIKLTVQSLVPWGNATQSPSSREPSTPLRSPHASFHAEN
ncbi:multiple PDZ domain protein [Caerostris extrusa]|uniref:Multiple PDZ domain protein n=1 Tax=Caerostris extrusa TaxID=172846 RepID=A0AAV4RQE1_CAEEX|nr:multiple PDZ domain protein [Caerostris extrusa]